MANNRNYEPKPDWVSEHIPAEVANSTLIKFAITLNGIKIDIDMFSEIDINYDRLEEQLEDTPTQFIWFASVSAELKTQVSILERRCKARRGTLTEQAISLSRETGYKPTAEQTKMIIECDDTLQKMEVRLAACQSNANKIHHMVEAMRMKSEHLRSLAGFKRQERDVQR